MVSPELKICSVDGCGRPLLVVVRGLCKLHYSRVQRTGSPHRSCLQCGAPISGRKHKRYCSERCVTAGGKIAQAEWRRSHAEYRLEQKRLARKRPEVQAQRAAYHREYRKRPEVIEARRLAGRIRKHHYRALTRCATAEKFDPFEIFERDKWVCRLCGQPTVKSKRGTLDPRAPELDHIIPLSVGGLHVRTNVQCACHACNMKKRNRPLGQLLMVG
jgi:predicted nucleic acid-binding Zn ribbon protein